MLAHGKFDTGVDAGRKNAALTGAELRRAGRPGRLRGRFLAARGLAAAGFAVFAALLTLPLQVQAQATLVSNMGQNIEGHGSLGDFDQAQAFTTGSNSTGYTLTSVEVGMGTNGEYATAFTVSIHSNRAGAPGTNLGTLTNPASLATEGVYAFTTSGIPLEASTTYFVVFDSEGVIITGSIQAHILNTTSNDEDSTSMPGWSIGNGSLYRSWDSSGSWTSFVDSKRMRVNGTEGTSTYATLEAFDTVEGGGGILHHRIDVKLSEAVWITPREMRGNAFDVTNGAIVKATRIHRKMLSYKGKRRMFSNHWRLTVRPTDADNAITVAAKDVACGQPGGMCIQNGGSIGNTPSLTVGADGSGPITLSISDATGNEDDEEILFDVTLSRASPDTIYVHYRSISGGTATARVDYWPHDSPDLVIPGGTTTWKVGLALIDDSVDDDGETVKVEISNARLIDDYGDVIRSLSITTAQATGTIRNTDPLPRALLARFGRTAAVHVVDHVEERLQAPRTPGFDGRFAGRELRRGMERDVALSFLSQLGGSPPGMHPGGAGGHNPLAGAGTLAGYQPGSGTPMDSTRGMAAVGQMSRTAGPMGAGMNPIGALNGERLLEMGLGGGDLLTGSAFSLNRETRNGGMLSFWSRGAQSSFLGREGALALDGDVRTTMFGADYQKGRLVAGLSLANSRGLGEYAGLDAGQVNSSVTGLYPWLGYRATDRITVWGVSGYGGGSMLLTPAGGAVLESGLSMAMAAAGTRGEIITGGAGGFGLAFKADALWVGTATEGVDGPAGRLAATEAAVTRSRTGLEGSRGFAFASGLALTPSVEIGLRHDGGDAETGSGVDVGGGVIVAAGSTGLSVDLRVRMLVVHQAEGFRERGVSVSLSYNPTPSTPLGFVARVAPSWGGQAMGGAQALWGRETMSGLAHGDLAQGNRVDAVAGYGLPVGSRLVGTPRIGLSTSEYGRDYRAGYGLGVLDREHVNLELGVDVHRRESPMLGAVDKGVLGRASLGW